MSSISDTFKSVTEDMTTKPYFADGTKGWQNIKADNVQNDIVFFEQVISGEDTYPKGGGVFEQYNCEMMFLTQSKHADTPEQSNVHIAAMRTMKHEFINRVNALLNQYNERVFQHIDKTPTLVVINAKEFDRYLTGILISFKATAIQPLSICLP